MTTLYLQNLIKKYGGRQVVNSVSLDIASGDVVGLLGPNGAGKTTTFYMTVGLVKPDAGNVLLDDEDITDYPMHLRSRKGVGYLPQNSSIFRKLSVRQNVMAILEILPISNAERAERAERNGCSRLSASARSRVSAETARGCPRSERGWGLRASKPPARYCCSQRRSVVTLTRRRLEWGIS